MVQATCQPDYYPCGVGGRRLRGQVHPPDGKAHHIIFVGERVLVDGKYDLSVRGTWEPTSIAIGGWGELNRVEDPKQKASDEEDDEYETSFSCGGPR